MALTATGVLRGSPGSKSGRLLRHRPSAGGALRGGRAAGSRPAGFYGSMLRARRGPMRWSVPIAAGFATAMLVVTLVTAATRGKRHDQALSVRRDTPPPYPHPPPRPRPVLWCERPPPGAGQTQTRP